MVSDILNEIYFFLPAIIILGVITSYEDLRYGKIRNKYIIAALAYSLVINIIILISNRLSYGSLNYAYFIEFGINIFLSLILGFLLWYAQFWTSGDAKLYLAFSALVPLSAYGFGYIKYMPSLTILINTFIPLAIFYFFKLLLNTKFSEKISVFKETFKLKPILMYILFIFSIMWLPQLLLYAGIKVSLIEIMALSILFSSLVNRFLKKRALFFIGISAIRLVIDKSIYSLVFLKQFIFFLFLYSFVQTFFMQLGKNIFSEKKDIKDLKSGMILAENIYKEDGKYKKEKEENVLEKKLKVQAKKLSYYFRQTGNGLLEEDVRDIKKLDAEKKLDFSDIKINKAMPFAHWIFIGVIITILLKGNFIASLINLKIFLRDYWLRSISLFAISIMIGLVAVLICYIFKNKKHYK